MIIVVPIGTCALQSNVPFYLRKTNLKCSSASLETLNFNLLQSFFDTNGYVTVKDNNTYDIIFQFAPSDLGYTGSGSIGLTFTDTITGKSYTLGQMAFTGGSTVMLTRTLFLTTTVNISAFLTFGTGGTFIFPASVLSYIKIEASSKIRGFVAGFNQPWQSNMTQVILSGVLTSGYKLTLFATYDQTSAGLPIFTNGITGAFPMVTTSSPITSTNGVMSCNIDSISADLKTIVVSVCMPAVINTVLVSSQNASTSPPAGTMVTVLVMGS